MLFRPLLWAFTVIPIYSGAFSIRDPLPHSVTAPCCSPYSSCFCRRPSAPRRPSCSCSCSSSSAVIVVRRWAISRTAARVGGAEAPPDELQPELAKRLFADSEQSQVEERFRTPLRPGRELRDRPARHEGKTDQLERRHPPSAGLREDRIPSDRRRRPLSHRRSPEPVPRPRTWPRRPGVGSSPPTAGCSARTAAASGDRSPPPACTMARGACSGSPGGCATCRSPRRWRSSSAGSRTRSSWPWRPRGSAPGSTISPPAPIPWTPAPRCCSGCRPTSR